MSERISIVTDEISMDLRECEAFLEKHDLHAVELRCIGGERVPAIRAADRSRLRSWAWNGGPRITAISPGLFKCHFGNQLRTFNYLNNVLPASIDLAVELGCNSLIAFTFEGEDGGEFPEAVLQALNSAAEKCEEADLWLLLENEPGFHASTGARTIELIEAVGHDHICANWDPCNSGEYSIDQLGAAIEAIMPRIVNVHVKNGILEPGERFARCGPLREGAIDWCTHLQQLQAAHYDGYLCLETHFQPTLEGSETILGELREMVDEVGYRWPRVD